MDANMELKCFVNYLRNVRNLSENTISAYSSDLREFFDLTAFKGSISEITRIDIETSYIENLAVSGTRPSSRARKLSSVRCFFSWCKENGIISENPAESIKNPKIPKKSPKIMSKEEIHNVILSCMNDCEEEEYFRNLTLVILMLSTGIRRAEVTEIKLSDVNLNDSSLLIHGKGGKDRTVYFNDKARAVLSEYIVSHRQILKPAKNSEYLFVSKRDVKLCVSTVNRIINKYLECAGIKKNGFTAHSLRRAFATTVYENTRDILAVQNLLGHSSPSTTQRYVGVGEEQKKTAAMTVSI